MVLKLYDLAAADQDRRFRAAVHPAMFAGLSCARLADASFAHPTMAEGLGPLSSNVPPRTLPGAVRKVAKLVF
jgi:hypothetical protein